MEEKNTFINTLIYSLITTYQTNELNLYIIDCDTQTLKLYEAAPQVGDVMFDNEEEKINNLFKFLNSEIEKRKVLFQEYNGSWDYYCNHSGKTIPARLMKILILFLIRLVEKETNMVFMSLLPLLVIERLELVLEVILLKLSLLN